MLLNSLSNDIEFVGVRFAIQKLSEGGGGASHLCLLICKIVHKTKRLHSQPETKIIFDIQNNNFKEEISHPNFFGDYVIKNNLSMRQVALICRLYGLGNNRRSYLQATRDSTSQLKQERKFLLF